MSLIRNTPQLGELRNTITTLGLVKRNIEHKGKCLIGPLYKCLDGSHLAEGNQLLSALKQLPSEEWLKQCGLASLETRRIRRN